MRICLLIAWLSLWVCEVNAAANHYIIDSARTSPSIEVRHLGLPPQRIHFRKTSGVLILDTAAKTGSIDLTIDTTSLDSSVKMLEEVLRSPEFFDAAKYPTIIYKSQQFIFNGDTPTEVNGVITLHGTTKPLKLTIREFICGLNAVTDTYQCDANAVGVLKRTDFGINALRPLLADEVKITIQVAAIMR